MSAGCRKTVCQQLPALSTGLLIQTLPCTYRGARSCSLFKFPDRIELLSGQNAEPRNSATSSTSHLIAVPLALRRIAGCLVGPAVIAQMNEGKELTSRPRPSGAFDLLFHLLQRGSSLHVSSEYGVSKPSSLGRKGGDKNLRRQRKTDVSEVNYVCPLNLIFSLSGEVPPSWFETWPCPEAF